MGNDTADTAAFEAPRIGTLASGACDTIADVGEVTVGHSTLSDGDLQTGVTVIQPHAGNPFVDKVPAAAVVINGFGKSIGLVQINELGTLETPIALTNTLSVGIVAQAMVRQAIVDNPEIGRATGTVNPAVFECNDGYLNDIQALAIEEMHYREARAATAKTFAQGAIGAGRGMSCFGLKGGIGSASRCTKRDDQHPGWMVGALVLSNFGRLPQLILKGVPLGALLGERLTRRKAKDTHLPDKGSIIIVVATDAPLDHRQLRRLATRAGAGLARAGSNYGHGSGDIVLAFSTAQTVSHTAPSPLFEFKLLAETAIDPLFDAAAEATEQAIVHALFSAQTLTGFAGHIRYALPELLPDWKALLP